jgi:hypothetical protein
VHFYKQGTLCTKFVDELNYRLDICRVTSGAHIESLRCVQNFECFSIDWCRCEVLSTLHLFSVSFLKCEVLLCSPCINTAQNTMETNSV